MKKSKPQKISLETDFTNIGFIIAIAVSALIITVSIAMIYINTPPSKIYAARVNGEPITLVEYNNVVNRTKTQYAQMLRMDFNTPTGAQMLQNIQTTTINDLVNNEVLAQAAEKKDLSVESEEINNEIESIKTKSFNGDQKLFNEALSLNKITMSQLKESVEKSKLIEKIRKQLTDDIKVTDKELKDYYQKNKQQYTQNEEVKASHILVKDQKLADSIYEQIKKGAKFEDLAKKHSTDPGSKDKGGDLDYFGKGKMVPEFEKAVWALKENEVSKPVKSNFGYHIIKKTGYKPFKLSSFDEVKKQITEEVKKTKADDVVKKFTKEERDKSKVEIFVAGDTNITPSTTPSVAASVSATSPSVKASTATEKK